MAAFINWGVVLVGLLIMSSTIGVHIGVPDFWRLPCNHTADLHTKETKLRGNPTMPSNEDRNSKASLI